MTIVGFFQEIRRLKTVNNIYLIHQNCPIQRQTRQNFLCKEMTMTKSEEKQLVSESKSQKKKIAVRFPFIFVGKNIAENH